MKKVDEFFPVKSKDLTKLLCNPWFVYFSDTAFGCVQGRLLQVTGTCYLNVILNGIILSETSRKLALHFMQTVKNPEKFKIPLNLNSCTKQDITFMFRLFYNVLCAKQPLTYNHDFIIEYSKLFSGSPSGEGGESFTTLQKLIYLIDPNFILLHYNHNKFINKNKYNYYDIEKRGSGDFLICYQYLFVDNAPSIRYEGEYYTIEFAIIKLRFASQSHVVVGFFCDDDMKIFDSNGFIFPLNWFNIFTQPAAKKDFFKLISNLYQTQLLEIDNIPVYVKQSTVDKYKKISVDNLCKRV